MGKIITIAVIVTFAMIFTGLLGIPTVSSLLFSGVGLTDISSSAWNPLGSSWWTTITTTVFAIGLLGGAIVAGLTYNKGVESFIVGGIAATLTTWMVHDMVVIFNYLGSVCPSGSECFGIALGIKVFWLVLAVIWVIAIIEWWRGVD